MYHKRGFILITNDINESFLKLQSELSNYKIKSIIKEKFLVEDAKEAIEEAYKTEENIKYIILGAIEFTNIAQNKLLKILEEPPKNIEFILITQNKSSLLPTILSRMTIKIEKKEKKEIPINLNISKLSYNNIFNFIKEHKDLSKNEAKELIEALLLHLLHQKKLSNKQLENFELAFKLLELNSRVVNILTFLMMSLYEDQTTIK